MDSADSRTADKTRELAAMMTRGLQAAGVQVAEPDALAILDHFVTIQPPKTSFTIGLAIMPSGGRGGGTSIKPGNVRMNIRKLVNAIASGVLTIVGVVQVPWTALFGALVVWESLYSSVEVKLTETEASVLWTLWLLKDDRFTVAKDGLLSNVNSERQRYGRSPMTHTELGDSLSSLVRIKSIKQSADDPTRWWLCEWVRVSYT